MEIIIDKIAIWFPTGMKGLTIRQHPKGRMFINAKGEREMAARPLLRYAKNYEKAGLGFCLFVRTFREDKDAIEAELDGVAKKVTEKQIRSIYSNENPAAFDYLDYKLKEDK